MIRGIRKTTSVKNLLTASCSGQVATLLTLSMVIVLIVIVATIKVGSLSTKVTTLSNAADSSALLLASQLSTKAYQLWDSLKGDPNDGKGSTEYCKKSSFLSMLLGAIFAIIAVVVMIFFPPFAALGATTLGPMLKMAIFVAISATAGAMGGAVGAVASGTNILQGAAQGAAIGAAIGGIAAGSIGMMNPAFFANTAAFGPANSALFLSTSNILGAIGTGVMGLGSTIYKAMSEANALDKSFSEAARALNGLPEKDIYRESVFLNAFSQTIEDQNTTKTMGICKTEEKTNDEGETYTEYTDCDPDDADNDGDEDEAIAYFSYWWDRRIDDLKNLFPKLQSRTQDFVKCDTGYQLYEGDPKNKSCKNDDDNDSSSWNSMPKDGNVPLKDFKYFAQSQYSALYEIKQQQSLPMSTGNEDGSQMQCYYDEYYYVYYCHQWTPGPLYRSELKGDDEQEWKKYLMNGVDSQASQNTCNYESSYSSEQFKEYKDTLNDEPTGDGVVAALAADMEAKGIKVGFYKSGLTTRQEEDGDDSKDKDKDTENDNGFCDTCALEPYHDEMEAVIDELNAFVISVRDLNKQSAENLASTWESWIKWFYDEGVTDKNEETCEKTVEKNTDDYYDTLQVLIKGEDLDCDGYTGKRNVTLRDCSRDDHPAITDSDGNEIIVDELQGLKAWKEELEDNKGKYINKLSECEINPLGYYVEGVFWGSPEGDYYNSYPCYDSTNKIISLDGDQEDEFEKAVTAIDSLIDEIGEGDDPPKGSIRYEMKQYDTDMNKLYESSTINFGGKNPVTYKWRDSACPASLTDSEDWDNDCDTTETGFCHSIKVQTSDFKVPWVQKKKSGGFLSKKICLLLRDYCYDPDGKHIGKCKKSNNPVWVSITKEDRTDQDMGILGNLAYQDDDSKDCDEEAEEDTGSNENIEKIKIKKRSRAYFSYNKLGLEDTK